MSPALHQSFADMERSYLEVLEEDARLAPEAAPDSKGRAVISVEGVVVERRQFSNDFLILTVEVRPPKGPRHHVKVKGTLVVQGGCRYRFTGYRAVHARYGESLQVTDYEEVRAAGLEGVINYLSSGLFPELGPNRARELVELYGERVYELLDGPVEEAVAALSRVRGITPGRANEIMATYLAHRDKAKALQGLYQYGLTNFQAARLLGEYGVGVLDVLREDPYRPAYEVGGFGFKTVDGIAKRMGLATTDPRRLRAAALYALESAAEDGHTWQTAADLEKRARKDLGVSAEALDQGARELSERDNPPVVSGGGGWYALARLHEAEVRIAQDILFAVSMPRGEEDDGIPAVARHFGCTEEQAAAVARIVPARVSVLTGGPGTGKTFTLKTVLQRWDDVREPVYLAAPTGKAAMRMEEATGGRPAQTIHRLLEYNPQLGGFQRHNQCPLGGGHVVIDESSMVDVPLMAALLDAIDFSRTTLALVGDVDQLPSVGPGAVLRDLIASGRVPMTRLTQIQRQAEGSSIIVNAHRILHGQVPLTDNATRPDWQDFDFDDDTEPAVLADAIVHTIAEVIPRHTPFDPINDVQVLAPMRKGDLGVDALNRRLQAVLNPESPLRPELSIGKGAGARILRQGDKVMQLRNNYRLGVYNGESGTLREIDGTVARVDFGRGRIVEYPDLGTMTDLAPAYCISIHKCVHPDTLVETTQGLLPIRMLARCGIVGAPRGPRYYSEIVTNPTGPALRIETRDGYELTATPEHGIDVWDGETYVRREARDLRPGDVVRLNLGTSVDPTAHAPLPRPEPARDGRTKPYAVPHQMSDEFAEFLGLMVADGTVYRAGFRLAKRHKDLVDRFHALCTGLLGVSVKRSEVGNAYFAEVNSTFLARWLLSLGGLAPKAKAVPEAVLRSPLSAHAAFLRGLFADGTVNVKDGRVDHIEWSTAYPDLERTVRVMLLRFGIISGRGRKAGRVYIYGANAATFARRIGFVERAKQSRLVPPFGAETRYTIPIAKAEASVLRREHGSLLPVSTWQNMQHRGTMSRETALRLVEAATGPEVDVLSDRLCFHHSRVASISPTHCESWCLTVPDGHQFLQNGFAAWNSQGSEYPVVVLPVHQTHYVMLGRQLIYTAVTRAKSAVLCFSTGKGWYRAVHNAAEAKRNTLLEANLTGMGVSR